MNSRRRGQVSLAVCKRWVTAHWPDAVWVTMYQPVRFSKPMPFDAVVFREGRVPLLVESRTRQWRVSAPQTRTLAHLPGLVVKEIWLVVGSTIRRRQWDGKVWEPVVEEAT